MTSRRRFLLGSAAAPAAVFSWGHFVEPGWLELDHKQCALPHLGTADRIRILQLSDLHVSYQLPVAMIEAAVDLGLAQNPDVVCLTGDFITGEGNDFDKASYSRVLSRLAAAAPLFASLGNHDGGVWTAAFNGLKDSSIVRAILAQTGAVLLHNTRQLISVRGHQVMMAGVGDLWSQAVEPGPALGDLEGAEVPIVLMAHNPDTKDLLDARYPWHLMLSGHTHGGQLRVPLIGTPFAPVRDQRYVEGLKAWNGRWIQVTRGVGNIKGMRINCRPQVSVIDLVGSKT